MCKCLKWNWCWCWRVTLSSGYNIYFGRPITIFFWRLIGLVCMLNLLQKTAKAWYWSTCSQILDLAEDSKRWKKQGDIRNRAQWKHQQHPSNYCKKTMQSIDSVASISPFQTASQYSPPWAAPKLLKSYGLGIVFRRVLEGWIFWKMKPESPLPATTAMECPKHVKHNVFLYLCGVRAGLKQITNVAEPL